MRDKRGTISSYVTVVVKGRLIRRGLIINNTIIRVRLWSLRCCMWNEKKGKRHILMLLQSFPSQDFTFFPWFFYSVRLLNPVVLNLTIGRTFKEEETRFATRKFSIDNQRSRRIRKLRFALVPCTCFEKLLYFIFSSRFVCNFIFLFCMTSWFQVHLITMSASRHVLCCYSSLARIWTRMPFNFLLCPSPSQIFCRFSLPEG